MIKYVVLFACRLFFSVVIFLGIISCNKKNKNNRSNLKPLAQVYDKFLYPDQLSETLSENVYSKQDSAYMAERLIMKWVKSQLMLKKAYENFDFDREEIEGLVEEYRNSLIIHRFKEQYTNKQESEPITQQEIQEYYDNNIENMKLFQFVVRCNFTVLPFDVPNFKNISKTFRSNNEKDKEKLQKICEKYSHVAHLNDSIWMSLDDVLLILHLSKEQKNQFLKKKIIIKSYDDLKQHALLKIYEYKQPDDIAPLEFVSNDIEKILLIKKKISIINKFEKKIYEEAESNGKIKIF